MFASSVIPPTICTTAGVGCADGDEGAPCGPGGGALIWFGMLGEEAMLGESYFFLGADFLPLPNFSSIDLKPPWIFSFPVIELFFPVVCFIGESPFNVWANRKGPSRLGLEPCSIFP